MHTFKELMRSDTKKVFLNSEEFGEEHSINGETMKVIFDDVELSEREKRQKSMIEGIFKKTTLIYVAAVDYGPLPPPGTPVNIDGIGFIVKDSLNEYGIYSLELEAILS